MDTKASLLKTSLIWLLLSSFLLVCNSLVSDINCLKSIKESLEDPLNYLSSSWNFNNNTEGFICGFIGVECWHDDENKVLKLGLSGMGLKGQFPLGIAKCSALTGFDLSSNEFFGPIPTNISHILSFATFLDLSSNNFSGEIPPDMAILTYLNVLKLDNNKLTGQIPQSFGQNARLRTFSVANNRLSGPVPIFPDHPVLAENYANNEGLCGGPLPPCQGNDFDRAFFIRGFKIGWSVFTALVFALSLFYLPDIHLNKFKSTKNKKKIQVEIQGSSRWRPTINKTNEDSKISEMEKLVTRMNFKELANATNNFSEANIIKLGKTGTTYKAILPNGSFLVIKRFYPSQHSEEHFESELTVLGRLRHNNLVNLLAFCYETKEKLLVYKYMPNRTLYDRLHLPGGDLKSIKWPLRIKIAVGLARGLAWLHNNSNWQVFHHSISSKCVLLDQNLEPKIYNFREAMIMNPNEIASVRSFTINGELLELGFDKIDVYGFGVVLLELVTGEEPTSYSVDWIINLSSRSFSLEDVVDNSLIGLGFDDEIFQFLSIARKCVQSFPDQTPTMLRVYQTMMAIGEKHGLVEDSEMLKQTGQIASTSQGDEIPVEI